MSEEVTPSKLLQDYDVVRRKEVELMTNLIDILPKIDNLDQTWLNQLRDAMFHADHPYMMVFVGPFNSGKSSLINALVNKPDLLKMGPTPVTDQISILRYGDDSLDTGAMSAVNTVFSSSPLLHKVSFVDTPGLESVFKEHDETTEKFLHRADIILLVMLATQAMTQSNVEYLQQFKHFGKKVVIVINQCDLLTDEERVAVRRYVVEQSKDKLGFIPDVWMMSAKWGAEAQQSTPRDEELWAKSGLQQIEQFVENQLGDGNRLRQKLQTPLQIAQNAHQAAVNMVKTNQQTYDQYRNITENVERQLSQQKADQQRVIRESSADIETRFKTASERARVALRDHFSLANVLRLTWNGVLEVTFLGWILRGGKPPRTIKEAFKHHKVNESLTELPAVSDRLPARLEGQDMKDLVDLATYARREVEGMKAEMRGKMIGTITSPATYDRSATAKLRDDLEPLEKEAQVEQTEHVERVQRNSIIYLALWQIICLILLIGLITLWGSIATTNDPAIEFVLLAALIIASLLGFAFIPLQGRLMHRDYKYRMSAIQERYLAILNKAADAQLESSMRLRRDTVSPLTRLIEAQATIQDKQLTQLKNAEQTVLKLESDLNALGKRRIFGLAI